MNRQGIAVERVRETAPTPVRAGAHTVDPGLSHPHLTQFVNELAAAPPDAERVWVDAILEKPCGAAALQAVIDPLTRHLANEA